MHIERLDYIARWLEAGAQHESKVKGFNMEVGVQILPGDTPACGAVCCIAGAATQFFNDEDGELINEAYQSSDDDDAGQAAWGSVARKGQELLGLDGDQAESLFIPPGIFLRDFIYVNGEKQPNPAKRSWSEFNDPQLAARVIRNLIATGEVNWEI